jgi:ElaB/YqjD/DUF883 family membrane-anchored ribosome-binding protein
MPARTPEDGAPITADVILEDLRAVVRDAEALLRSTEGQAGEKVGEIRARVEEALGSARTRLQDAGADVGGKASSAARSTDTYVHENPWVAIAVAAGIGFVLGLAGRRR